MLYEKITAREGQCKRKDKKARSLMKETKKSRKRKNELLTDTRTGQYPFLVFTVDF